MKSTERHKLKENEFARQVAHAREVLDTRKRDLALVVGVILVAILAVSVFVWWRQAQSSKANESLAAAIAVYDSPVVPVAAPAPGSAPPVPQAGTFQTEKEKLQAALPKFQETADKFGDRQAGLVARFHVASILASLGRYPEAEQRFQEVVQKDGSSIYGRTAKMGLAEAQVAQGKYDSAITVYTDLSRDTTSQIPVDSVLMALGRTYVLAGRKEEAARTFDRVVQEFPQSLYLSDARREGEAAKKS